MKKLFTILATIATIVSLQAASVSLTKVIGQVAPTNLVAYPLIINSITVDNTLGTNALTVYVYDCPRSGDIIITNTLRINAGLNTNIAWPSNFTYRVTNTVISPFGYTNTEAYNVSGTTWYTNYSLATNMTYKMVDSFSVGQLSRVTWVPTNGWAGCVFGVSITNTLPDTNVTYTLYYNRLR